jgi:hypothetical protein
MAVVVGYDKVQDAIERTRNRYLLLGNGFSIALRPDIFTYGSLYKHADLSPAPHLAKLFEALSTEDFEIVIRYLVNAAKIIEIYSPGDKALVSSLRKDAGLLKEILVSAIAKRHPDRPYDIEPQQYVACRRFLAPFGHIYTLNYDVLLYWTLMQSQVDKLDLLPDDGFRHPEDDPDQPYVSWQEAHKPTIHYLHGALHLFDTGMDIIKYTWSKTDIPIVEQIRDALSRDDYPLFVAEGTFASKKSKIMHNAYLHKALRSFEGCVNTAGASLVIFGHSLAQNDAHVLRLVARGKVSNLYVSLFGDPDSPPNHQIIQSAEQLVAQRAEKRRRDPLTVTFFDASTAHVWG